MAERCLKGLCFNCPEKFSKEHLQHCSMKGIYLLELDDVAISDDESAEEGLEVSMHAITGIASNQAMHLEVRIASHTLRALIDTDSTHSFAADQTTCCLGLSSTPQAGLMVGVANGDRVPCTRICKLASIMISGEAFSISLYVLPLEGYELVLRVQ